MRTRGLQAVIVCVMTAMLVAPAGAAAIRNVYFSNGSVVPGQIVRSEGELPAPTKTFERDRDKVARLFFILGDFYSHTFKGELKGSDGRVARKLDWTMPSLTSTASWRYTSYGFSLNGLAPGDYSIDLLVDDAAAGTYTFTLK